MKSNTEFRAINPVKPVAPYIGGKRNLAKRLVSRIKAIPHATYAEPFVGMGGVFLRRDSVPKAEVINDYSRDVATFFRILQHHYVPFMEMMRLQITSRVEFERLVATNPDTLTDLQRSARFLYLQRTAFGGRVSGKSFGVSVARPARFNILKLAGDLEDLHARLAGVVIECLPCGNFIRRYDKPGTLFYLDPPYWGSENDYGKDMFSRDDFARLAGQLVAIKGQFLLSINDTPEIREIFQDFDIEPVETTYSLAKVDCKMAGELIISGRH